LDVSTNFYKFFKLTAFANKTERGKIAERPLGFAYGTLKEKPNLQCDPW
jgi:hypothetical protein